MTDEEFQRIKEAEKDRLRAQKRLRNTMQALKRRNEVQSIVRRMSQGATHLLRETEALAETLATQAGRQAARLELALEDESVEDEGLQEAEEALREERAEEIVRRLKSEQRHSTGGASESSAEGRTEEPTNKPEKTIGRMGESPSSDSDS